MRCPRKRGIRADAQRVRNTLLSYLQRLPHSEPFRQHENAVMELMIKLMKVENEENALLCIKIMIDGFRNHKVRLGRMFGMSHR